MSNNTYEKTNIYVSKQSDFVKKYIETIKSNKYAEGFDMLDSDTKMSFNSDLGKYTEFIIDKTAKMNKDDNGTFNNIVNEIYLKSEKVTKYDIISKKYTYRIAGVIDVIEEFIVFDKFNVIEYAPNNFFISLK
jgi:primase-polymerase (primpol)-like protein